MQKATPCPAQSPQPGEQWGGVQHPSIFSQASLAKASRGYQHGHPSRVPAVFPRKMFDVPDAKPSSSRRRSPLLRRSSWQFAAHLRPEKLLFNDRPAGRPVTYWLHNARSAAAGQVTVTSSTSTYWHHDAGAQQQRHRGLRSTLHRTWRPSLRRVPKALLVLRSHRSTQPSTRRSGSSFPTTSHFCQDTVSGWYSRCSTWQQLTSPQRLHASRPQRLSILLRGLRIVRPSLHETEHS